MPTKPTFDGSKAKFIMAELDDRAADMQVQLLDLLEKTFEHGHEAQMRLVVKALQDVSTVVRITTLLRSGRIQEAENIVMGLRRF